MYADLHDSTKYVSDSQEAAHEYPLNFLLVMNRWKY